MKIKYSLISLLLLTACSNMHKTNSELDYDSNIKNEIKWIEQNLAPLHSLVDNPVRYSIQQIMAKHKIPGINISFVDNKKIAWNKSYGYANIETQEQVTEKTVFTGAFLSKPLTAMAALNLVESGELNLDEDVNLKLTSWKVPENQFTQSEKVTLRRLISHRAGIRNDLWSSYLSEEIPPSLTQMLAGKYPSVDPATSVVAIPGTELKYSNPGYSIIQQILKDVTEDSFDNVLNSIVLQPSGMNDSSFEQPMPDHLQKRRAIGYDRNLQPYTYKLFPYKAAGGVWTTPSDMANFVITLFEDYSGKNNILSSNTVKQVFSRQRERLGFSKVFNNESEDLVFRHYGSNQGFTCYLVGSLQKKQAVVIMTNSDNGFNLLDYIARSVAEYYQWDYLQPMVYQQIPLEENRIQEYVGVFGESSERVSFNFDEKFLWLNAEKYKAPVKLVPVGKTEFIDLDSSTKYEFYRPRGNSNGAIKWVKVIQPSGQEYWAEKES